MSTQEAILVEKLSKKFLRTSAERPRSFQELFSGGVRKFLRREEFWALHDINFKLAPGKMMGIIGRNGAGKSTLLRLVGGVGKTDQGRIEARGRIGALIDLGAGFHPDLTGRENVSISGVISGLTRSEVASRFDEIVAFAELEAFIDSPLRTYSTGMQMRLAFAVAAHIDPGILLVDEVLAVGDLSFQRRCLERIARFKENGCAILLVSHDLGVVEQLCDEVIWLQDGRILRKGPADVVVSQYKTEMSAESRRRTLKLDSTWKSAVSSDKLRINENRFGSLEMEITAVTLLNDEGIAIDELASGRPLSIQIEYQAPKPIPSPIFSVTISKEDDSSICFDVSTETAGIMIPTISESGQITLRIDRLDLTRGGYYVDVGIYERAWAYAYDYHWHVYPIRVLSAMGGMGILNLPHYWIMNPRLSQ